eukprot:CAMPEP_0195522206 /NCGR_PEP_ID=MMETSP0794_2-20130614/20096_1 /TAXON_ID=515487 /ORGANISM="Stephanopyxis turris, Strain CCMP 815" /LENGTH=472 /DNA_ID=CAMNT_0040651899 /DNA_START=476 /DNA_END=1894 /DNA_ORIENTATION=-
MIDISEDIVIPLPNQQAKKKRRPIPKKKLVTSVTADSGTLKKKKKKKIKTPMSVVIQSGPSKTSSRKKTTKRSSTSGAGSSPFSSRPFSSSLRKSNNEVTNDISSSSEGRKKRKLLTKSEERDLIHQIHALRRVLNAREEYTTLHSSNEADDTAPPTIPTEEQWAESLHMNKNELHEIIQEGQDAWETLLACNAGLVHRIAQKYQYKHSQSNGCGGAITLSDMIQEGNLGLMEAAERFDPERGFRFVTYATYWVRQRIGRCIANHSRAIRLPVYVHTMLRNIYKKREEMTMELGRPPTLPELAQKLDIPIDKLQRYDESSRNVLSLELPLNSNDNEDNRVLSDGIACTDSPSPEEDAEKDFLRRDIRSVIQNELSSKESDVLVLRFGLDDGNPKSAEEAANRLGVSRERVRLIEARALNKLRHPGRNYKLKEYVVQEKKEDNLMNQEDEYLALARRSAASAAPPGKNHVRWY